jgi:hypothetical protein
LSFAKTKTVCLHSYPLNLKKLRLLARVFLSFWYGFVVILKWCQGYLGILICINYYLNSKMASSCFGQANKLAPLASFWVVHAMPKLHRMLPFKRCLLHLTTPITVVRRVFTVGHGRALDASFSLPPSLLSLLRENRVGHCKKTRKHDSVC